MVAQEATAKEEDRHEEDDSEEIVVEGSNFCSDRGHTRKTSAKQKSDSGWVHKRPISSYKQVYEKLRAGAVAVMAIRYILNLIRCLFLEL